MARVLTLGPFYAYIVGPLSEDCPAIHRSDTTETRYPYRLGRDVVIRIGSRGLVLGTWREYAPDEDVAMALAIGARPDELFDDEGDLQERFERHVARKEVARHVSGLDEEWKYVNVLELMDEE